MSSLRLCLPLSEGWTRAGLAWTPDGGIRREVEMGGGSVGTIRLLAAPVFDCAYGIGWYCGILYAFHHQKEVMTLQK